MREMNQDKGKGEATGKGRDGICSTRKSWLEKRNTILIVNHRELREDSRLQVWIYLVLWILVASDFSMQHKGSSLQSKNMQGKRI